MGPFVLALVVTLGVLLARGRRGRARKRTVEDGVSIAQQGGSYDRAVYRRDPSTGKVDR
jgi:hypothetical protein